MRATPNLTGRQFGYLTVEQRLGKGGQGVEWRCLCVCGRHVAVATSRLTSGGVKSCGCQRGRKALAPTPGESAELRPDPVACDTLGRALDAAFGACVPPPPSACRPPRAVEGAAGSAQARRDGDVEAAACREERSLMREAARNLESRGGAR